MGTKASRALRGCLIFAGMAALTAGAYTGHRLAEQRGRASTLSPKAWITCPAIRLPKSALSPSGTLPLEPHSRAIAP
jgi:hypothetical protein